MKRSELDNYLEDLYHYEEFEDGCYNGLQVEGGDEVEKVLFSVSFSRILAEMALENKADAVIVHHGFFGKNVFRFSGALKQKIMTLMKGNISLYGIHLPMDAQSEIGNNAVLLKWIGSSDLQPFEVGFTAGNSNGLTITEIMNIYAEKLGDPGHMNPRNDSSPFMPKINAGSEAWTFGPPIPRRIACVSGGAPHLLEAAAEAGADTYITGEVREYTPALAMDLGMNFIKLGHYRSEKAGILALMEKMKKDLPLRCEFIDISNTA